MIRIHRRYYSQSISAHGLSILPSKVDFGKTSGIFSNWNFNQSDELIYLKNSNKTASSLGEYFISYLILS